MHMKGTPLTMQGDPSYPGDDVVAEVAKFLSERRAAALGFGVHEASIILDPGIGFGKTVAHNAALIRGIPRFAEIGSPVLIGHSGKSFLAGITGDGAGDGARERSLRGLAVTVAARLLGARLFRVHDAGSHAEAIRTAEALIRP